MNVLNEIQKLEKKIDRMLKLSSAEKFRLEYFESLKYYKSNKQCFDALNEEYYELFGQYRYSDFSTFKVILSKQANKK